MRFVVKDDNSIVELVELTTKLNPKDANGTTHALIVELRANPDEIEDKIGTISVAIKEATIAVELFGLEVVPKTRLGQGETGAAIRREFERETTTTKTREKEGEKKAGFSFGLSTDGPEANLDAGIGSIKKESETISCRETETVADEFFPVRAMTGNRWKVRMKDSRHPLNATFLDGDTLCEVTVVRGSNRVGVETKVVAKQKHIEVRLDRDPSWISLRFPRTNTQEKIMKALIAKTLHERDSRDPFAGEITFSKSLVFDEG